MALDRFDTGNYDAMYLAGLVADDLKLSREDLQRWVERVHCHGLAEYTVAWVAAESSHGWEMALRWVEIQPGMLSAGQPTADQVKELQAAGYKGILDFRATSEDRGFDEAGLTSRPRPRSDI